jgi:hypothetical protein
MTVYKSAANLPTILMHLTMAKFFNFKTFSLTVAQDGSKNMKISRQGAAGC